MKVSILSAVFNEAEFISEMIDSVQAQDHTDWELLFVDDGSSDDTVGLIQARASIDGRICIISHGTHTGKVNAFNLSYAAASGDVIVLLAGDDRLPPDSLRIRHDLLQSLPNDQRAVAFFKIRTFSESMKYDGMVIPRGNSANRSGGSITMTKALSDVLFPIDKNLISEDIWLSYAAAEIADVLLENTSIVLDYRIHDGNSNPRQRPFAEMTESMHLRHEAWPTLLNCDRFDLSTKARQNLAALCRAEELRYTGKTFALICSGTLPLIERAALASMSAKSLYSLRSKLYRLLSGWRR